MKFAYSRISEAKQKRKDKIGLISAGTGLILGATDSIGFYSGALMAMPILMYAVGLLDVVLAILYDKIKDFFIEKNEVLLLRINGVTLLITGISYQISGSNDIQYAYYGIAVMFLIVLPFFVSNDKQYRKIDLNESEIRDRRFIFKTSVFQWDQVEKIMLSRSTLELVLMKKVLKYHFFGDDINQLPALTECLSVLAEQKDIPIVIEP